MFAPKAAVYSVATVLDLNKMSFAVFLSRNEFDLMLPFQPAALCQMKRAPKVIQRHIVSFLEIDRDSFLPAILSVRIQVDDNIISGRLFHVDLRVDICF